MRRIRFRTTRLLAVAAIIELLMGTVMYGLGNVQVSSAFLPVKDMLPQLAVAMVAGGSVLLLLARAPVPRWMRYLLIVMPVIPLVVLTLYLRQDPLTPLALGTMAVALLTTPFLPENRGEWGENASIWADLSATVFGVIALLVSFRSILTPSSFNGVTYGFVHAAPWLFGVVSLASATVLLVPLTGRTLLEPWTVLWRFAGGTTPALLALAAASTHSWGASVLWGIWSLVIFRGLPVRGLVMDDARLTDLDQKQEDQIYYMERLLEIMMWVLVMMLMTISALGGNDTTNRTAVTLFALGTGVYNVVMHLIFPDLGTPERRIFSHLAFLTMSVGTLMFFPQPLHKDFLAVLAITPFLAARLLGAKKGSVMMSIALVMSIGPDLAKWLVQNEGPSPFSGAAAFGLMSVKVAILSMAGWMGIHSASEQLKLVGELAEAREEQLEQIAQLERLANYDALTGLFNRRRFRYELEKQLEYTVKRDIPGALCFLDLDGFKYINDSLGHQAGDELLKTVAELLRTNVRDRDIVARLGGDEFAVILPGATRNVAEQVATRVLDAARKHTGAYNGHQMRVTASIGIVMFPEHGMQADELLSHADVAMYQVKENGRNGVHVFVPDNIQIGATKLAWEKRIRDALDHDGFELHAQPIVDLSTGRTVMYEVLLRMIGDKKELIPPGAFLGIAERFGLIHDIDRWVVRKAIHLVSDYRRLGRNICFTVNISGKSLADTELLPMIKRELMATGINPGSIVFEITETAAISDLDRASQFINALRALGFRFAVDDFGNGYSTFSYLKRLNVDFLKIDGNFIKDLAKDDKDLIFVKAIVQIARGFHMTTIAEFVENEETVALLQKFGVTCGQGYYLGRPRPVAEVLRTVQQ